MSALTRLRPRSTRSFGVLVAAGGAISYGVTVVIGRSLAGSGVDASTALGCRFGIAALALALVVRARRVRLKTLSGEWLRIVALGAIGYTTESTLFYMSLQRGSAAACALLFYSYPTLVTVLEISRGRVRLTRRIAGALCLSVSGAGVVVAAGSELSITAAGAFFALASATTYALYLLVGREIGRGRDSMVMSCWVAVGASLSSIVRGALTGQLGNPTGHAGQLLLYGLATAFAFTLTFAAMRLIGPARTAVVMTLEAVTAVILGAVFLGEPIAASQAIGGLAVLAAAAIIAVTSTRVVDLRAQTAPNFVAQSR